MRQWPVEKMERILARYDSLWIWQDLRPQGTVVRHNRVARLMRLNDRTCKSNKKFKITTDSRHKEPVAENILDRKFDVAAPNTVWVSDITYLPTKGGWLYRCVVIDLFDRMVVGCSMRTDMTAINVIDAFTMAVIRRKPKGPLVFQSDRGVQYCALCHRQWCQ